MASSTSRSKLRPPLSLDTPLTYLKGCGPFLAQRLARLGLERVGDLLLHFPSRYEDRRQLLPLDSWPDGAEASFRARIVHAEERFAPRRQLKLLIDDGRGQAVVRLFHPAPGQRERLRPGRWLQGFGVGRRTLEGLGFAHPELDVADSPERLQWPEALTPVYPITQGLTQARLRSLIQAALEVARTDPSFPRAVPGLDGPDTLTALCALHQPAERDALSALAERRHPAQLRLIREELLAQQISLRWVRARIRAAPAPVIDRLSAACTELAARLPFTLTPAQQRVIAEIGRDLAGPRPMLRLVQGDVGSGKTVVAAVALLAAVRAGWQGALMAPTELLAEQHARNFERWLAPLGVPTALLSGSLRKAEKARLLERIAAGEVGVVLGTHALFQQDVHFARLALVVVDEQHRFGVRQRLALRDKGPQGASPHQLVMSATPIPRTLAQTRYADLDVSVIDQRPPGRTPVKTVVFANHRRPEVLARIGAVCREGRQAYWVCTLVESSEQLEAQAAEETAALLRQELPGLSVGLVHGRLRAEEKERQMRAFQSGATQLLVATTVIEVGVDVPNASIMIIENAERLGLAQLHQLRGRVGRGSRESQCVLMYQPPLSETARERLAVMRATDDGFVIAEKDLELRGPGELLGQRQTGVVGLRIADAERDAALVGPLQPLADRLLAEQEPLARALVRRWVGDLERFGQV